VNSSIILDKIRGFTKSPGSNSVLLKPLPLEDYLGIMKNVDLMIGNSSAGIVEAPLFELPVVNIGDRQKGRDCMKNVIHADCGANAIRDGIEKALSPEFRNSLSGMINIYGDGQASDRIADIISNINWKDFSALKKNYLD
jgi:GDP/UDP-N,N'-diacetylbacillosamine 2-epimerase (hydrolysing)